MPTHPVLYVILWEFHVKPGAKAKFERIYGPEGDWVRLFRQGKGYVGTELIRDAKNRNRYVTLDFWASQAAYDAFRAGRVDEYKALDQACEALTEREVALGGFAWPGRSKALRIAVAPAFRSP